MLSFPDFTHNSIISNLDLNWLWRLGSVCLEASKIWTHCFSPPPVHNTNPMKTSLDHQAKLSNTLWHQVHICHSCHTHTYTPLGPLVSGPCFTHYTVYQARSGRTTSTVNGTRVIMTERAFWHFINLNNRHLREYNNRDQQPRSCRHFYGVLFCCDKVENAGLVPGGDLRRSIYLQIYLDIAKFRWSTIHLSGPQAHKDFHIQTKTCYIYVQVSFQQWWQCDIHWRTVSEEDWMDLGTWAGWNGCDLVCVGFCAPDHVQ